MGTQNSPGGFVRTDDSARSDAEALSLRSVGLSYREVAAQLGVDTSTAWRRCQRALADIPRDVADEYRALENLRLDALFQVAFEKALEGSLAAIDRCVAIMTRAAKLNGLDAPSRIAVETPTYSAGEIEARVAQLAAILDSHPDYLDG